MIDPARLEKQRLSLVTSTEAKCARCGRRTRDKSGVCMACRTAHVPALHLLTTEQIVGLIGACRAELKKRRDEIDGALEGA